MQIESIRIKNYRLFRDVTLEKLPRLCVLVGANGTGKSTFFDVFSFLKDALSTNVTKALNKRGGWEEVVSRGCENEPIEIILKFRLKISGKPRLVTYTLQVSLGPNRQPQVERETLSYKRGSKGYPFSFLDFKKGKGQAISNEGNFSIPDTKLKRETQTLDEPDILAIKGLGQFERFIAASGFRSMIENWHISDLHITDARRSQEDGIDEHLSPSGDNLPVVANSLHKYYPERFNRVLDAMKQRVPGIEQIEPRRTEDGRLILRFADSSFKDPFIARHVSDGTIKMFAYLVLLNEPKAHPLLAIEEPENQLYPKLLAELADEFTEYSERGGQVFVSTHSPDFLNALELDSIFCLHKENGFTKISRASDSDKLRSQYEGGNLPGWLWNHKLFEGLLNLE